MASERAIKLKRDKIFLSLFMPKGAGKELQRAYSYLRSVDDLVDADPPRRAEYFNAKERLLRAISGEKSGDRVVDRFAEIAVRRGFRREWFDAFFNSMEMDLRNARYETRADLEQYVSGVADAPAEMICSICGFKGKAREGLSGLARSIEYLNLLRDLGEDLAGGRSYVPLEELRRYGLRDASEGAARENKAGFMKLVKAELARYDGIAREADEGPKRLPAGYGLPLLPVSSVYQ
ncbi:MAG: squalene/phytoene synthase family protein, partial [Candidatus ainarchaeum sp.]|nr:squalene/phytoene synthase family protein [Candidatus ainarchaeum sp.]